MIARRALAVAQPRLVLAALLALAGTAASAETAAPQPLPARPLPAQPVPTQSLPTKPLPGGPDFISPVGEPYHAQDRLSGAEHWFAAVDADHDGRIGWPEYLADAERFFARLDADHDRQIGPEEIERYETAIAPEVRVASTGAEWQPRGDQGDDSGPAEAPEPDRIGAGRYSWIDLPEPLLAMDANFDRAISHKEYLDAARRRFVALDVDHDGVLTRDELPRITVPRDAGGRRRSPGRGQGGRHHGGMRGMNGGMDGGMGGLNGGMDGGMIGNGVPGGVGDTPGGDFGQPR